MHLKVKIYGGVVVIIVQFVLGVVVTPIKLLNQFDLHKNDKQILVFYGKRHPCALKERHTK